MENNFLYNSKFVKKTSINLVNDRLDEIFFFLVFLLGSLFITLLKAFHASPFIPLLLAISLVIGYGIISINSRMLRLPEERIADNCYYMGFLFTLVSLSNALFYFSTETYSARNLVSDFGVALGSTIAGVVARIIIQQMRIDTEVISNQVRESLTEAAQATTADLHNFISEVGILSQTFKETLTKSVDSVSTEIEQSSEMARSIWKKLGLHLEEYTKIASELEKNNKEAIEKFSSSARIITNSIIKIDQDLKVAGESAVENIKKTQINLPTQEIDLLKIELKNISDSLHLVNTKLIDLETNTRSSSTLSRLLSAFRSTR